MKKIIFAVSLALIGILIMVGGAIYYKSDFYKNIQKRHPEDIVLHLKFDKNNIMGGTRIKDLSGNGNDGTILGNINWAENISGSAFKFDGKTYIDCGHKHSLKISNNITIEAWVSSDDIITTHADARIVMKGKYLYGITRDERAESNGYYAYTNSGPTLKARDIKVQEWHHVVLTYDGDYVKLYINGVLRESAQGSKPLSVNDDDLYVGGDGDQNFHGLISEVKVHKRVLQKDEIINTFETGAKEKGLFGFNQDDLVLHLKFDRKNIVDGTTIKDLSGKGNDGTIRGKINLVEDISGSAFNFDGNTYIDCGNKSSLNLKNNITIEAWVSPDDIITTHADARIVMKGKYLYGITRDERAESNGYYAYINGGTALKARQIKVREWQHTILTYDGDYVKFYINGVFQESLKYSKPLSVTDDNLYVGGDGDQNFHGRISEVKIYQRALQNDGIINAFETGAKVKGIKSFFGSLIAKEYIYISFIALIILAVLSIKLFKVIEFLERGTACRICQILLYVFISFIATYINYPLARFPGQDIIFSDQLLLGRISWGLDAIQTNPFASVDFLQGLGSNVMTDMKVIFHFYDPAILLSLFTGAISSLWFRSFFLILYCLFCLEHLWKQQFVDSEEHAQGDGLYFPLLVFYIFSPQFFGEVGHNFSAIFYAIPGVVVGLRAFVSRPTILTCMGFIGASTLFISLSDLFIIFLAPTLGIFLFLFDPLLKNAKKGFIFAASLSFIIILLFSYIRIFVMLSGTEELAVSQGYGWSLATYYENFLNNLPKSLLFPVPAFPIWVYIAPYLPVFILILLFCKRVPVTALKLVELFLFIEILFMLGIAIHGIEASRVRLPGPMRYHVAIIPFLISLWILFHANEFNRILDYIKLSRVTRYLISVGVFAVFLILSILWFDPKPNGYIVFDGVELNLPISTLNKLIIIMMSIYPALFLISVLFGKTFDTKRSRIAFCTMLVIFVAVPFCVIRSYGLPLITYTDRQLFNTLYVDLPKVIDSIIQRSPYSGAPRSIVPIALGTKDPLRGRNDKLLPFIEFPESVGGRAFFNWRYSYSSHINIFYAKITHQTTYLGYFPPTPQFLDQTIDFAITTESPFLISADALLKDDRLQLLGSYQVKNDIITRHPDDSTGLLGEIYLYGVKPLISENNVANFRDVKYSRATVHFSGMKSGKLIKLPITYSKDLRACNEFKKEVTLFKGGDGFAYVRNDGSFKELSVSSFSILALLSLLAPLVGGMFLVGVTLISKRKIGHFSQENGKKIISKNKSLWKDKP